MTTKFLRLIAGSTSEPWRYVLVACGFAACLLLLIYPLSDFDTFWHLANARAMVEQGRIVDTELFSYTAFGTSFDNHAWLAQLLFYWIVSCFGLPGLTLFKGLLGLVLLWTTYRTLQLYGLRPVPALLVNFWLAYAVVYHFTERPNLFSLLFLALVFHCLEAYRLRHYGVKTLWLLPPLFGLWDVLHGSAYGVVLLVGYSVGYLLNQGQDLQWRWANLRGAQHVRGFVAMIALTLLVVVLNPYGFLRGEFFTGLVSGNYMVAVVGEFLPTPFIAAFAPFWAMFGIAMVVVAAALWRRDWIVPLVLLPFAYLAVRYSRASAPFCVLAAPLIARYASALAQHLAHYGPARVIYSVSAALAFAAVLWHTASYKLFVPRHVNSFGVGLNPDFFPLAAVKFLDAYRIAGNMFNSGELGGYLAYAAPQRKIFLYNHHTVFNDLLQSLSFPQTTARWNFNYALLGYDWQRYRHLFPIQQWAPVFWEQATLLMLRRTPENQPIIDAHEISYFSPRYSAAQITELARDARVFPQLLREIANYLHYRADEEIATAFADLIVIPHAQLDRSSRVRLIEQSLASNRENAQLRRLVAEIEGKNE